MIRLNLLPHRTRRRQRREQRFHLMVLASLFISLAVLFAAAFALEEEVAAQRRLTQILQTEHLALDTQLRQSEEVQRRIAGLAERRHYLDALQWQRNDAVQMLDELARAMPAGVQLRSLKQNVRQITLHGHATTHQHIALLLDTLKEKSGLLRQIALHETRASGQNETEQHHDFVITAKYVSAVSEANRDEARP